MSEKSKLNRLGEELRNYWIISSYLLVCFLVLEVYRSSVLSEQNLHSLTLGVALFKALIIGKFILIGQAIKLAESPSRKIVLHRIILKTLAFWVLLIVLILLEEMVEGWIHDTGALEAVRQHIDRPVIEFLGPSLVMLMVLIPIIFVTEVNRALGEGKLRSLMFSSGRDE